MNQHHLIEECLVYDPLELNQWKSNADDCIDILINSNISIPIKKSIAYRKGFILNEKGKYNYRRTNEKGRPYYPRKTMHYDVAKTAIHYSSSSKAGWYGSYDWMTNESWIVPSNQFSPYAADKYLIGFMKDYQSALIHHIGMTMLKNIQSAANRLPAVTPPDLWFVGNNGKFHFVEAKLDRKTTEDAQIAGLALLKVVLGAEVKIIRVSNRHFNALDHTERFSYYCNLLL